MTAEHHDKVMAITSHIPHLIAYNIVGTAANLEKDTKSEVIKYSASGFRDFTRIASSIVRGDVAANNGAPGGVIPYAYGIPVLEVPLLDENQTGTYTSPSGAHGDVHLTFPDNVIVGVKRDITVHREFKPKKDTTEYTLFLRVGTAIENPDAFVVVKNVKVAAGYDTRDFAAVTGGSYTNLPASRP